MISSEESLNVIEYKNFYVVIPNSKFNPINKKKYILLWKVRVKLNIGQKLIGDNLGKFKKRENNQYLFKILTCSLI